VSKVTNHSLFNTASGLQDSNCPVWEE